MGWLTRFELATTGITIQGSTNWAIATTTLLRFSVPLISIPDGTPERIRTFDLWLRRPTLYPTELRAYALSAEWNNTYITLLRLVLFQLFLLFDVFFSNGEQLKTNPPCDVPPVARKLLFIATTYRDIITYRLHCFNSIESRQSIYTRTKGKHELTLRNVQWI